jgi:hypothetical protein
VTASSSTDNPGRDILHALLVFGAITLGFYFFWLTWNVVSSLTFSGPEELMAVRPVLWRQLTWFCGASAAAGFVCALVSRRGRAAWGLLLSIPFWIPAIASWAGYVWLRSEFEGWMQEGLTDLEQTRGAEPWQTEMAADSLRTWVYEDFANPLIALATAYPVGIFALGFLGAALAHMVGKRTPR